MIRRGNKNKGREKSFKTRFPPQTRLIILYFLSLNPITFTDPIRLRPDKSGLRRIFDKEGGKFRPSFAKASEGCKPFGLQKTRSFL
jgi:hypothetical protein